MSGTSKLKAWHLLNNDDRDLIEGQFYAVDLQRSVGAEYADHFALNRQVPITQYLHGKVDTSSFRVVLFQNHALDDVTDKLDKLISWTERIPAKRRPPLLSFWAGEGYVNYVSCVITDIDGIQYKEPNDDGLLRHVECTIKLKRFVEFDPSKTSNKDTRYHNARERDYYELICQAEYGDPMLGDVIRKRHPWQANLETGDVVKLPSAEGLVDSTVKQTSIVLQSAYGKRDTPQRSRRVAMFSSRNRTYWLSLGG
jgi:hypothetical protein